MRSWQSSMPVINASHPCQSTMPVIHASHTCQSYMPVMEWLVINAMADMDGGTQWDKFLDDSDENTKFVD